MDRYGLKVGGEWIDRCVDFKRWIDRYRFSFFKFYLHIEVKIKKKNR